MSVYDVLFGRLVKALGFSFVPEVIMEGDEFHSYLKSLREVLKECGGFVDLVWSSQVTILKRFLPEEACALFPSCSSRSKKGLNFGPVLGVATAMLDEGFLPGYVFSSGPSPEVHWLPPTPAPKPRSSPISSAAKSSVKSHGLHALASPTSPSKKSPKAPKSDLSKEARELASWSDSDDSPSDPKKSSSSSDDDDSNFDPDRALESSSSEEDLSSLAAGILNSAGISKKGNSPILSFAPVHYQKIFKLDKFLPNYSEEDEKKDIVAVGDRIQIKKRARKIASPSVWMVAMNGLGRHLAYRCAAQKGDLEFEWDEFHVYTDRVHAFFGAYTLESVLQFDIAFRKWRRFHGASWSADNTLLRDMICRIKVIDGPIRDSQRSDREVPVCRNFNRPSGCNNRNCRYRNVCFDCGSPEHGVFGCPRQKGPAKGSGGSN